TTVWGGRPARGRARARRPRASAPAPRGGRAPPPPAGAGGGAAARAADNRDHPADGPENRSLQERCLAFTAGPPIQPGPYNNFVKILQFGDRVVVYTEMIHDARIVWLDGRLVPPESIT